LGQILKKPESGKNEQLLKHLDKDLKICEFPRKELTKMKQGNFRSSHIRTRKVCIAKRTWR